jgi:hypothetical protein
MKAAKFFLFTLLFSASVSAPALAEQEAATPAATSNLVLAPVIDPQAHDLAVQMIKLIDTRRMFQRAFHGMTKNIMPLIARDNPNNNKDAQQKINDAVEKIFLSHIDEIDNNTANLYAQSFSADELREIVNFYQSPIGQKILTTMPDLLQKSMTQNMPIFKAAMKEMTTELPAILKDSGMKVPKELSL